MIIGLLSISVSIPEARSLKDKRMVLRSMKDRIMHRMNVSVAEIGKQDAWKFADLAFVTVAAKKDIVDKRLAELVKMLQSNPRWVLMEIHTELL
jgi:uncharacterized protein YlxP (DUF503 family)